VASQITVGRLGTGRKAVTSSVRDDDIQSAEPRDCIPDGGLGLPRISRVADEYPGPDRASDGLKLRLSAAGDDHICAIPNQPTGNGRADPGPAA
jgi:hypothetical protein